MVYRYLWRLYRVLLEPRNPVLPVVLVFQLWIHPVEDHCYKYHDIFY